MAVKRVKSGKKLNAAPKVRRKPKLKSKKVAPSTEVSKISLPTEKKKLTVDLLEYILLVYGREKIGKTTLFSSFPDALFITTEPGTKGLEIFENSVNNWGEILQIVKLLEKNKKFKYIIFDTADRAYDMCLDWVCQHRGIEYPGQDDSGREDYGRSWRAVKQDFTDVIHRIIRTGRGVGFTSHMKETEIKTRSGEKYDRIYPSMGNQARTVIEALVDLFFFADYVKGNDGQTHRILITEGDESIWAGHRKCAGKMPQFLPLEEEGGYDVIADAFTGDHPGVNPDDLSISKQTSETAAKFLRTEKAKSAQKKSGRTIQKGGPTKKKKKLARHKRKS